MKGLCTIYALKTEKRFFDEGSKLEISASYGSKIIYKILKLKDLQFPSCLLSLFPETGMRMKEQ